MTGFFGRGKSEELVLKVEGMSCQHCVGKVENGLKSLDGVIAAEVDLDKKEAKVRFDPEKVNEDGIRKKITETGYQVV